MARVRRRPRPARLLERLGLPGTAHAVRRLAIDASIHRFRLRPDRAARGTIAWAREPVGRRSYRVLTVPELLATRRGDTAFVFGSGKSILEISDAEWERIAEHETIGFSHFHRQRSVRVDYHLVAELQDAAETSASIRANQRYANAIFIVQKGWVSEPANDLVGRRLLPDGARIFRFRRLARARIAPPSLSLARGLAHGHNSSLDVANFAIAMGWKRIVIAGVDLYDKEYFWLPPGVPSPGEAPGITTRSPFPGGEETVRMFGLWREIVEPMGIELSVYNPRSLLSRVLPVFEWPTA
jgi:hypothetical protein